MKVFQVNVVYKEGSTGNIIYDIHDGLKEKGINSIVCYGRGKRVIEEKVYKTSYEFFAKYNAIRARITGLQYGGSFIATTKLNKLIKQHNPDIVHLHCINGYFVNIYKIIDFLKKKQY